MGADEEEEDLEPVGLGVQGNERQTAGRRLGTLLVAIGVALAVFSFGYALGGRAGRETVPAVCDESILPGDRVIATVDVSGLGDDPVDVLAPLRAPSSDDLLPVGAAPTFVKIGSRWGHQYFRPKDGHLVILFEVHRAALGRDARIADNGDVVARSRIVAFPACAQVDD